MQLYRDVSEELSECAKFTFISDLQIQEECILIGIIHCFIYFRDCINIVTRYYCQLLWKFIKKNNLYIIELIKTFTIIK